MMDLNHLRLACCLALAMLAAPALSWGTAVESQGLVVLEAEDATVAIPRTIGGVEYAWTEASNLGAFSGRGFMEVLPDDETRVPVETANAAPELQYTIQFENPGTYYVWLRAYAETEENTVIYAGLHGTPRRLDVPRTGQWAWSDRAAAGAGPVTIDIPAAGLHTLQLWMGDSGLRLDRILLTRNPNYAPEYRADFWRDQNIYQIVTDRFFDGDPSNNNAWGPTNPTIGNRTHGGDFRGVEMKLDYIKALGATAIWLSPVLLNGKGDVDYHGYGATDFYRVDPRFGSLQDLQRLVAEAHKRGLLVINDVVVNHASTWVDSAESGWPNFRYPPDGYTLRYNSGGRTYAPPFDPASLQTAFGNSDLRNIFNNNGTTQNWGDPVQVELGELLSLDDFRTTSPYVRHHMRQIWTYWLRTVGFDAYRIDTVKHVEMGFWNEWSPAIREAARAADKPNFFQFGEVYDGSDAKVGSYTGTKSGGNYKMESVIDYPLYYLMPSVFSTGTGSTGQIESRYNNLTTANYDASALNSLVLNLDNHDQRRFLNFGGGTARLEVALTFLYTSRGIPALYYGTEQDFDGGEDPFNRENMFAGQFEFGPSLGDNFNMVHPRFKRVAKLNNLRRLHPVLRTGSHHNLWANFSGPGLFAYARRLGNSEAYVVLNTATSSQTIATRPTIHPPGTVLVNVLNPTETLTVTSGVDGIPSFTMPPLSSKIFLAAGEIQALDPVVEGVVPVHDSTAVTTATAITLGFSQAMDTASVEAAFSTLPSTTGSFTWSQGNTTVTYTPSGVLTGQTLYAVRLAATAADAAGLTLHAPFESRFTTGASSGVSRPSVTSSEATDITDNSAVLRTTVRTNGAATAVAFEYGLSSAYGSQTPWQNIGSVPGDVAVSTFLNSLQPGRTYHFRTMAENSAGITYGPDITFTTTSSGPQLAVTTYGASFINTTGANLNGSVNPGGNPVRWRFVYGTLANVLGQTTDWIEAGSGTETLDVFTRLEGLEPGTTYFYALEASTGDFISQGGVQSLTTRPIRPTVISTSHTGRNPSGATLVAAVNPNGFATSVVFEYGPTPEYGAVTLPFELAAGEEPADVEVPVTGLDFGRTYHFRAVATNDNGTTFGPDSTFTTGNPPPSVITTGADEVTAGPTSATATFLAQVNPNGDGAGAWIEYGPTPEYGATTQQVSADDTESYASFSYTAPNNNGGIGFDAFSNYSQTGGNRGNVLLVTANSGFGSAGRQIDGAKSFGVTAGTSTANRGIQTGYRPVLEPRQFGTFSFSLRCDVSNSRGFTGLNLKSERGTTFSAGELISVGMRPEADGRGGNNALVVSDASGFHHLDFGSESRGALFDVVVDFDTLTGRYRLTATRRAGNVVRTHEGRLKLSGADTALAGFGYANANNSGEANQNLIFDNLLITATRGLGDGLDPVAIAEPVTGLAPAASYHFRAIALNSNGLSVGANQTVFTGTDLTAEIAAPAPWRQGDTAQMTFTVTNIGAVHSTGEITATITLPAALQLLGVNAEGWSHDGDLIFRRDDGLAASAAHPAIVLDVLVDEAAPAELETTVRVEGGGDAQPDNNLASATLPVTPRRSALEAWRELNFGTVENTGSAADTVSFSGDGLPNLIKYALGLDPTVMARPEDYPQIKRDGGRLTFTFRRWREATGLDLRVVGADDLAGPWAPLWESRHHPFTGDEDYEEVTVEDPSDPQTTDRRFLRLEATPDNEL